MRAADGGVSQVDSAFFQPVSDGRCHSLCWNVLNTGNSANEEQDSLVAQRNLKKTFSKPRALSGEMLRAGQWHPIHPSRRGKRLKVMMVVTSFVARSVIERCVRGVFLEIE